MFANARRPHGYHHHLHPQQPLSVCRGCGFSTRHAALLDRHRRHCTRSSKLETGSAGSAVQAAGTGATSSAQRRVLLPAPSVCRNYKCSKCSFVTNRAKLFLYHQNCIHGENINVYGCDHCEYASRHKNKVLRHKRLVHKVASISNETPTRTLISADNTFPQPVSSSTPQQEQQQQQQQQQQQLPLTTPSTSDFKSQSPSGALDCPVDLSASEEASIDASAAEESDNNNLPDGGSGAMVSSSRTSALDFIKTTDVETPSNSETVNRVDIGGELSDGGHVYYSMKYAENATLEVMETGTTEALAETATTILSSCAAGSAGGEMPSVPLLRCRYCRYTNRHKWKMASHVRASHSAGRPVYRCPECPRFSTDSRVEWSAHRSRHTGKVMFECPECAYATTMKRNYERHLERHRAGGPRRCGLCSYSSTGEGAIQRHMAEYHPPSPNRPLPPRIADSPLAPNGGHDDDEMTSGNLSSLTSRPLEISFGDGSVGDNSTSGGPMSFQMGSKQDTLGGRSLSTMKTGSAKPRATSSSSTLPFDTSDSAPGDSKLSSLNGAANPTRPSKSVLLNLTNEGAITLSTLTSKTAKLPIAALQFCSGGGLSPAAVGRCVCPMCPLSYKRPADLNRHMKQKHETTLKEFVLRNRLSRATSPSAETSMWPSMSSISPVSALTAHGTPSRSGIVSPDGSSSSSSSSSSVVEIPLNLSTKDQDVKSLVAATRCGNEVVNLSMNAPEETSTLKLSTSCEQSEPLDLSTLGGSDIKKQSSASTVPDVTILDAAVPLLLVGKPQPPSQRHLEPIVSAHRPARTTIGGVQIFRTSAGYPCGHCTYVSKRASDLRRHQLVHSTSSKRYRCPHCPVDRSYKLQFDLGRHLSRVHGHLTATTGTAGTATTTVSTAAPRRHTGSVKMISLIGRKSAPDDGDARYTTLSHDSPVWTSSSGTVKNHLACPYCQYVGKSLAELERHARLHSGEKPHRCPFCAFSTIWKSDMKVHLQKLHREESALTGDFEDLLDRICRNVPITVITTTTVNNQPKTEVSDVTGSGAVAVDHNMNVATVDGGKTSDIMITTKSGFHFGGRTDDRKFPRQSVPESSVLERPLGRCPLCPFQCQTPSEMSSHLQTHEKKPTKLPAACGKLFVCTRCSISFPNRSEARNHVVLEHSEISDPDRAIEEKQDSRINAAVVIGGPSTTSSSVSPHLINPRPKEGVKFVVDGEATSDSHRKSPKPTSSIGTSVIVGDVGKDRVDEVEKLAEQYANVVTEMLYGNESTSTSTSVPAINQLCRYAATSMSPTAPGGSASIKGSPAAAEATLISGSKLPTPSSLSTVDVTSKIPSQSTSTTGATGGRFRPYKCSQCGKRSNWRWDLKKHIRSSRHPHADVVVLSDREARESFHEIADQMNLKRSGLGLASNHHGFTTTSSPGNRQYSFEAISGGSHGPERHSFVCSTCGFRSGSKADLVRHTLLAHPSSETSSTADGDFGTLAPSTASASPSGTGTEASTLVTLPQERALYTVDRQKLKRLHCSACPYRSNFRSDVGRHIRHKHPNSGARIEVMTSSEAAASLADYLDTWARKKFVLSPVKTYRHMDFQAAAAAAGDPSSLTGNGPEDGKPTPVVTMGNFVGCSSIGYAQGVGDEPEMEMEDETLPWKCAACDFTDPGKQAVVEHWQKWHCGGRIHVDGENPPLAAGSTCSELTTTKLDASGGTLVDSSSPSEHSSASRKRSSPNNTDVQPGWGKPLQCDICPYRTNKLGLLTIHKTYHRPQSKNSHKCPHCPYYVCAPRLLHQHVRIHSGYGGSPQQAAATSSTARHQIVDGNTSTEDSVATGDQVLASSSSSAAAAAAVTGNRTLYPCASCPYVGHNRNDYIYHRQFHRQRPSAPFKCERCPYWVGQRRLLTQHRRVHAQAYRMAHPTESSTKVVSSSANLGEGARDNVESNGVDDGTKNTAADPKRSPTAERRCLDRVEDASALAVAVVVESGPRTSNLTSQKGNTSGRASGSLSTGSGRRVVQRTIWRCDRCPYSTAKRSQLETHRQLHGSGQRYTCERCDYSVSGVHLLLQHVRLHESGNSATAPTTGDVEKSGREDLHPPSPSASTSPQQQHQQQRQHVDGGKEEAQRERESKIAVIGGNVDDGSPSSMSGSRPLYRCDKCPYANARRDHLLCHAKFHSGVGPLVCPYCDYSVSKVHLLTQHARVHAQSATGTVSTTSSPVFPPFTTTETKPNAVPLEPIPDVELTVCRRGEKHDETSAILPEEDLVAKSLFLRTLHLTTAAAVKH